MSEPSLSIVVTVYNKEDYVAACLESIRAQTDGDFEVVVVDDGSADGSADRAAAVVGADRRFTILRQANGGVSSARNAGIAAARGQWVAFLDGDDTWSPAYVAIVRRALRAHPEAVMVSVDYHGYVEGRLVRFTPRRHDVERIESGHDFFGEWTERGYCHVHTSGTVILGDVLRALGGFPEDMSLGEDLYTWIRVSLAGRCVHVREPLVRYRMDASSSLARTPSLAAIRGHLRLIELLERMVAEGHCSERVLVSQQKTHLYHLLGASRGQEAFAFLLRVPGLWGRTTWGSVIAEILGVRTALLKVLGSMRVRGRVAER
jgi:glycosyltransferase involved in cell wall biosynthesis